MVSSMCQRWSQIMAVLFSAAGCREEVLTLLPGTAYRPARSRALMTVARANAVLSPASGVSGLCDARGTYQVNKRRTGPGGCPSWGCVAPEARQERVPRPPYGQVANGQLVPARTSDRIVQFARGNEGAFRRRPKSRRACRSRSFASGLLPPHATHVCELEPTGQGRWRKQAAERGGRRRFLLLIGLASPPRPL